jgi:small subunit ribosomal protein S6
MRGLLSALDRLPAEFKGNPVERRHTPCMREYEYIFIVHPDLDENAFKELVEKVKGWITGAGGQVLKVEPWGRRKLAYPIRKQTEGQYVQMNTMIAPAYSAEFERNIRFLEPILRYLVTVK